MVAEKTQRKTAPQVTWAQAVRDIFVTSINRGQLPILGMIAVALLLIYRLPEADAATLALEIVASLKRGELWAYVAEFVTVVCWYLHSRGQRQNFLAEAERIGREKSAIQSKAAGVDFKSSRPGRVRKEG